MLELARTALGLAALNDMDRVDEAFTILVADHDNLWLATTVWLEVHRRLVDLAPTDTVQIGVVGDPDGEMTVVADGLATIASRWTRGDEEAARNTWKALDAEDRVAVSMIALAVSSEVAGRAWVAHVTNN